MEKSDIDLVYAGIPGKAIMIEGRASEISEEDLRDAMVFADSIIVKECEAITELSKRVNKPKKEYTPYIPQPEFLAACEEFIGDRLRKACTGADKLLRQAQQDALKQELKDALTEKFTAEDGTTPNFDLVWEIMLEKAIRTNVLEDGVRQDGRKIDEIRPISCEVGVLPRVHGSALFKRGDTQKNFILHYNFPAFSTGEVGRYGSTGRREIGHGALAERSVYGAMPKDFPYTTRVVSEILGSNGSSSMATVCGSSLALMDAGVPLSDAVVGISVGLVTGTDKRVFLTDILGSEDHYGDMDFKVAGTTKGITGFQLDLKIAGLDLPGMYEALLTNKAARAKIRKIMSDCIAAPRPELSPNAPQMLVVKINPDKIGALIGPGGKNIRGITDTTGAKIDVEEDGTVKIFAQSAQALADARYMVEGSTGEAEIGKIYKGVVKTIKDFGCFVEFMPGIEGMVHISELADYRVKNVEEICKVGDQITVKVIDIDDRGRIRLSRKAALAEM